MFDRNKYFKKELNSYLATKMRVDSPLAALTSMLSESTYFSQAKKLRIDRNIVYEAIDHTREPFKVLKLAMLTHKCILSGRVKDPGEFVSKFFSVRIENSINPEFIQTRLL